MSDKDYCNDDCCCHSESSDRPPHGGSLVGRTAPDFTTSAVMPNNDIKEDFNLHKYLDGSYGWLFFYPLDFTFVCPSEIIAHDNRIAKFQDLNTKVISVSIDSHFSHFAWKNTPVEKGGIGNVQFPMVADITHSIAKAYGVEDISGVALRGSFLIDKGGIVRHITINDTPLGREVDEGLRMIEALQHFEKYGEVCPAGWRKGDEGMKADASGVSTYLAKHNKDL